MTEHISSPKLFEKQAYPSESLKIGAPVFVLRNTEQGKIPEAGWTITAIDRERGIVTSEKNDGENILQKNTAPGTLDLFAKFQDEMQSRYLEGLQADAGTAHFDSQQEPVISQRGEGHIDSIPAEHATGIGEEDTDQQEEAREHLSLALKEAVESIVQASSQAIDELQNNEALIRQHIQDARVIAARLQVDPISKDSAVRELDEIIERLQFAHRAQQEASMGLMPAIVQFEGSVSEIEAVANHLVAVRSIDQDPISLPMKLDDSVQDMKQRANRITTALTEDPHTRLRKMKDCLAELQTSGWGHETYLMEFNNELMQLEQVHEDVSRNYSVMRDSVEELRQKVVQ